MLCLEQTRPYVLAVNGGHLRSTAIAAVVSSGEQTIVYGPPLNPHPLDPENFALFARSESLFQDLAHELGFSDPDDFAARVQLAVVALPGAGIRAEQDAYLGVLREAFRLSRVHVVDDTWAALYAETRQPYGVCAFAGCGASVCIATGEFIAEKSNKIDGWGPVIGDFGSGFQIVTRLFRALGRSLDSGKEPHLYDEVRRHSRRLDLFPELPPPKFVQRWFDEFVAYHTTEWRAQFARLAEPICGIADSHSRSDSAAKAATSLLTSVAKEMARSLRIAANRGGMQSSSRTLPLVLQGGVLRNSRTYQEALTAIVGHLFSNVIIASGRPVDGCLKIAVDRCSI